VKTSKPIVISLLVGIVVIGTAALYFTKFLADFSPKSSLDEVLSAGIELFEKKQYQDARAKFEECYEKAPEGSNLGNRALLFISRCYGAQGAGEKAAEFWGKVIENPAMRANHAEAFYSLATLRSAGGTAEDRHAAEDYCKKAAAVGSGSRFEDLAKIELASLMLGKDNLAGAQQILQKLLKEKKDYPQLKRAMFKLRMKLLFSPAITEVPESQYYVVQGGDTLEAISKRFGTTADLLKESNNVDPRRLQIGKRLKVVTGKFRLKVSKSRNILQLLSGDMVLNEYRIGTGKFSSTPVGEFKIVDKVKEPPWFKDGRVIRYGDPENVLGTRWMKLESVDEQSQLSGYGIHGTDDESSIGKESSQGCIRLFNRDVEELYKIVPVGTEVTIED